MLIRPSSKVVIKVLSVLQKHGTLKTQRELDTESDGSRKSKRVEEMVACPFQPASQPAASRYRVANAHADLSVSTPSPPPSTSYPPYIFLITRARSITAPPRPSQPRKGFKSPGDWTFVKLFLDIYPSH